MTCKHLLYSALIFVGMACGGGGGGCGGCACLEPLEGGFPVDELANSAGQLRVTGTALDFIETNMAPILGSFVGMTCPGEVPCPGGSSCADGRCMSNGNPIPTLGFRVPPTRSSGAQICEGAGTRECNVYVDINNVEINPIEPNRVDIAARMDLNSDPIKVRYLFIRCDIRLVARNKAISVPLTLRSDNPLRRLAIEVGDPDFSIESGDVRLCGGLNWMRGLIIGLLRSTINDSIRDAVRDAVDENLYQNCDNGCPENTACGDGYCRFPGGAKVPVAMGVEGRIDLGAALAGQGPEGLIDGVVDIGLVAGGTAGTRNAGVEIGLMGGARVEEPSACVPELALEVPQISPVQFDDSTDQRCEGQDNECGDGNLCSDGFCLDGNGNRVPAPFHIGFGMSQQYMEQMLKGFHQGGALCLKVGSELSELISSSTMSLLMPSITQLVSGHQPTPSPMRLSIVPRQVPNLEVGAGRYELVDGERIMREPLLHINVDDLAINFELLIQERFVRIATVLVDLRIGLGLTLDGEGNLVLAMSDPTNWIGDIEVQDAQILLETEEEIAETIPALLELAMPALLGNLDNSFALPELGIFTLQVDAIGGVRPRADLGEDGFERFDYLGLFASLGLAQGQPDHLEVGTRARLVHVEMGQTQAYRVSEPGTLFVPEVNVELELNGAGETDYEYSWRVDDGLWRIAQPVNSGDIVRLRSHLFSLQGAHRIELRGRLAGNPATTDRSAAVIDVVIDTEAPELTISRRGDMLLVKAWDRVSQPEDIEIQLLADSQVISQAQGELETLWPADAELVTLRAEDASGLISRSVLALPQIVDIDAPETGEFDVATAQGCSCAAVSLSSPLWLLPLLALRRRRRRRAA